MEHTNTPTAIVLAAGNGSRMSSSTPKILHHVGGAPILFHVLWSLENAGVTDIRVVVAPHHQTVQRALTDHFPNCHQVIQPQARGTGDAVACAVHDSPIADKVLVTLGDAPLVTSATFRRAHEAAGDSAITVLGMHVRPPHAYGQIFTDDLGQPQCIIEADELSHSGVQSDLCNTGIMAFDGAFLQRNVDQLRPHPPRDELQIPDLLALAYQNGAPTKLLEVAQDEARGVNTRADLAQAEAALQRRWRDAHMANGVTFQAPESVHLSMDTTLAADVTVEPNVVFGPGVQVDSGALIRAFSHIEGTHVGAGAVVGPYARLRGKSTLGEGSKIGNFVEIKNVHFGAGAKASHLAYVGDAHIGAGANIGAGTIFCNYDGFRKHHTHVGDGAFIGSNTTLIAPRTIGTGAVIGGGTVVTRDVADNALASSSRTLSVRADGAHRYRHRKNQETESE